LFFRPASGAGRIGDDWCAWVRPKTSSPLGLWPEGVNAFNGRMVATLVTIKPTMPMTLPISPAVGRPPMAAINRIWSLPVRTSRAASFKRQPRPVWYRRSRLLPDGCVWHHDLWAALAESNLPQRAAVVIPLLQVRVTPHPLWQGPCRAGSSNAS